MLDLVKKTTIIVLLLFFFSGCCYIPDKHTYWHRGKMDLVIMTDTLTRKNETLLTQGQLVALLGEPDDKITLSELNEIVDDCDPGYRERLLGRLNKDESFRDSNIYLYDESKHFDKPLGYGCLGRAHAEFESWIFVVKDSYVVAVKAIPFPSSN